MTQQEIQSYSVKMAEMMAAPSRIDTKDLKTVYYQFNEFPEDKGWWSSDYMKFHTSYDWQIPLYRKVYAKLELMMEGPHVDEGFRIPENDFIIMGLQHEFDNAIAKATPLDSFAILCKATDLIETKK